MAYEIDSSAASRPALMSVTRGSATNERTLPSASRPGTTAASDATTRAWSATATGQRTPGRSKDSRGASASSDVPT